MESTQMTSDVIEKLMENGVMATMLCGLIWWMTTRHEKLVVQLIKQQAMTNLLVVGLQKEVLCHDLTVTGLNPSTGDNIAERDSKALAKYNEIATIFVEIEKRIAEL